MHDHYQRLQQRDQRTAAIPTPSETAPTATGVLPDRYKTQLCRTFSRLGSCLYGDKCAFAHGWQDLRAVTQNRAAGLSRRPPDRSTANDPHLPTTAAAAAAMLRAIDREGRALSSRGAGGGGSRPETRGHPLFVPRRSADRKMPPPMPPQHHQHPSHQPPIAVAIGAPPQPRKGAHDAAATTRPSSDAISAPPHRHGRRFSHDPYHPRPRVEGGVADGADAAAAPTRAPIELPPHLATRSA